MAQHVHGRRSLCNLEDPVPKEMPLSSRTACLWRTNPSEIVTTVKAAATAIVTILRHSGALI
jgi:hypothetical protein